MRLLQLALTIVLFCSSVSLPAFGQRAPGDDCDEPLEVYLDWGNLPYQLLDETTCGRGNDYNYTVLGNYDEGEDFILKFELPVLMSVMITVDPHNTSYTGVMVFPQCYPGDWCIAYSTKMSTASHQIDLPFLDPGTYYIMVDNWPSPDCIPSFDLRIEEVFFDNWGENCGIPIHLDLSSQPLPLLIEYGTTCGLVDDYESTCLGDYDGGEDMIFELNVPSTTMLDIILDPHSTSWTGIVLDNVCPPGHEGCIAMSTSSSAQVHGLSNVELDPGTYYLMVDTWPAPDCIPQFDLLIDDPYHHQLGDNCGLPQELIVPEDLPFTFEDQYTVGRGNDYSATCLGDYDEGEDFILQLDVTSPVCLDISLDPRGHHGTGVAIAVECPPGAECIAFSTNDNATTHGLAGVSLGVGLYYIIVDCTASTGNLNDFNLSIETCPLPPENDKCGNAIAIGNVVDLPFSTTNAILDGPAECQSAPNIWYCYTAQNTGVALFSLCGSSYDTYLAVYEGCDCGALGDPLGCDDDHCGLQSELNVVVALGQQYLIEIGGSAGATGSGVLTAYIAPPECGNVNGDGVANITDAVYLIQYIFNSGPEPLPMSTGDANCDQVVNITDAVCLIQWIFSSGPPPCDVDDDGTPDCWP